MPLYDYQCTECDEVFEIQHGMHATVNLFCPKCKGGSLGKLLSTPLHVSVRASKSDLSTLGHLAERNTEGMSDDEREYRDREAVTKKIGPRGEILSDGMTREVPEKDKETVKLHKKINKMSPEQKKRYIETGNT